MATAKRDIVQDVQATAEDILSETDLGADQGLLTWANLGNFVEQRSVARA